MVKIGCAFTEVTAKLKVPTYRLFGPLCIANIDTMVPVTLPNASDYRANGLLSDYIGWTNGLGLALGV